MEKRLSLIGYWLGLICTVLTLIFRPLLSHDSAPHGCSWRHGHFLYEFLT